jgi:hypothetical protein
VDCTGSALAVLASTLGQHPGGHKHSGNNQETINVMRKDHQSSYPMGYHHPSLAELVQKSLER